jgi:hypothetical protein
VPAWFGTPVPGAYGVVSAFHVLSSPAPGRCC